MSEIELAFYCCAGILWALSGEGGPELQAITIIGLIVFFRMMASGSNDATGSRSTYIADNRKAKKFGISPSRIRGYDVLIDYIQFHSSGDESPITSIEEGISRFEKIKEDEPLLASDAKNFFSSPYVIATIGLGGDTVESEGGGNVPAMTVGGACTVAGCPGSVMFNSNVCYKHRDLPDHSEKIGDDWWEEGYSADEGVESDAGPKTVVEMEPSPTPSTKEKGSEDTCGEEGCSTAVNAFDFRCFTCRKRYCQTHGGKGVDCQECSDK
ncbi:MAG: hypothetical protein QF760_02660 [Candidatus Thalassarchaeaceae archaeon]|jgi:hypothetical protein|nr:hypothetical protein [Candidatus Thalassarchaeaceae archaeon]MDP6703411.1 hypothetical protein [Candidatus Thalassarchaeaceae archaeon]MDP7003462.1 hypothetical protein [Candidatus Thalassarchaeaceae archaeon]